jgi:hypothetical protein
MHQFILVVVEVVLVLLVLQVVHQLAQVV